MESKAIRENVGKAYDSMAERYTEWTTTSHGTRLAYLNRLLELINEQPDENRKLHALELGCGAGVPCTQLLSSQKNMSVTANDISSAQISLARTNLPTSPSVELIVGDMMDLTFPPVHFDMIIAMYSIVHLPRDDQTTMLQRLSSWLKPGGYFLANFSATSFESEKDKNWLGATEGAMYWSAWGVEQTCEIVASNGLEIVMKEVQNDVEDGREVPFLWLMARKVVNKEQH